MKDGVWGGGGTYTGAGLGILDKGSLDINGSVTVPSGVARDFFMGGQWGGSLK